jgi:VanZ family protein
LENAVNQHRSKDIFRWLPSILVMAVIFWASATPSSRLPSFGLVDTLVKKGGHFLGYALLGIANVFGFGKPSSRTILTAILLAFLYACTDELHQMSTAGRHPSPVDVGIDTLGATTGALLANRYLKIFLQGTQPSK